MLGSSNKCGWFLDMIACSKFGVGAAMDCGFQLLMHHI